MARTITFFMGILVLCSWKAIADAEYIKYKDPKQPLNARINDLMSRMTLEEKIGQMVQIDRSVASAEVMKKYFIGSILSGGGSVPAKKASAETWMNMVNDFQKGSLSTRLGIPMIYGIDAVHGHNNVYKATIFPHNVGLGATRDPGLVKKIGAATALEVRATGISYVFAPCIAVCRDPRWGRCYESYSEDPKIVQAMTEIIPGLQGEVPANSQKGFPFVASKHKQIILSVYTNRSLGLLFGLLFWSAATEFSSDTCGCRYISSLHQYMDRTNEIVDGVALLWTAEIGFQHKLFLC